VWLSNGVIFNDVERPLTQLSRSRCHSMLNIPETIRDRDIVTMEYNRDLHAPYSMVSFRMTLSNTEKYSMTQSIAQSLCDSWAACCLRVLLWWWKQVVIVLHQHSATHSNAGVALAWLRGGRKLPNVNQNLWDSTWWRKNKGW